MNHRSERSRGLAENGGRHASNCRNQRCSLPPRLADSPLALAGVERQLVSSRSVAILWRASEARVKARKLRHPVRSKVETSPLEAASSSQVGF